MSVDRSEVHRIAALARLRLESSEAEALTLDMNRILEHVDRLQGAVEGRVDSRGEEAPAPTNRDPDGPFKGVRADGAERPDPLQSAVGDFAPDAQEGFFVVPPPPGVVPPPSKTS